MYVAFYYIYSTWNIMFHDTKFLSKTIVFYHLGSINWGKIISLLKSAINDALFHRCSEWCRLFEEYSKRSKWEPTRLLTSCRLALVRPNLTLVS